MDIWHYDHATGELLGAGSADADPLEEGAWLIPAFATPVAPPAAESGHVVAYRDSEWTQIADHRGETWWDADGNAVIVTSIGNPADNGLTNVEPPPKPEPVPETVTRRQMLLGLIGAGFITADEGIAAASSGALPADVQAVIATLSEGEQVAAKITWAAMSECRRDNALVALLAASKGLTDEQVDGLFRTMAGL